MRHRRFGRTELQMPVFSCGGMRYQKAWKDLAWSEVDDAAQQNLEATIHRSLELGINHIETARGYGSSEMQLGKLLPTLPREKMIIQTKVGPAEKPEDFLANFEKSMAYLKLDYVDLFSLHGINEQSLLDLSLEKGGCLDIAEQLRRDGRVRHIGFSTHAPCEVIVSAIETGRFDYVNLHWYYINQRNAPAIAAAKEQDMGMFIISPSDKGGLLYKPSEKIESLCAPLTPMGFNDLFCLTNPDVHTLSIGASCPTDFDAHVEALAHYDDAAGAIRAAVVRLEQELAGVEGEDWLRYIRNGLPEWDAMPGGINVQVILLLWTLDRALDLREYAKMRYNLLGNAGHWFPGLKFDAEHEAQYTAWANTQPHGSFIIDVLKEADQLFRGEEKKRLSEGD